MIHSYKFHQVAVRHVHGVSSHNAWSVLSLKISGRGLSLPGSAGGNGRERIDKGDRKGTSCFFTPSSDRCIQVLFLARTTV